MTRPHSFFQQRKALSVFLILLLFGRKTEGRKIKIVNSCGSTLWPALFTGGTAVPSQETGWEMKAGQEVEFQVDDDWTAGRIWARTGCAEEGGRFTCLTGGCGGGVMACAGTGEPPATLAEFTLASQGVDHYDISLVDGFNVPINIYPSIESCQAPSCQTNINALCPSPLRSGMDDEGVNLGCLAACNAGFGQEKYGNRACCSGGYNDPELCAICGVDYYSLFKDNCETAYAYAYDGDQSEKSGTALWTCPASSTSKADYTIEFCPLGSDFKGTNAPSEKYANSTASCQNKVTSGDQVYEVKPSPTSLESSATGMTGTVMTRTSRRVMTTSRRFGWGDHDVVGVVTSFGASITSSSVLGGGGTGISSFSPSQGAINEGVNDGPVETGVPIGPDQSGSAQSGQSGQSGQGGQGGEGQDQGGGGGGASGQADRCHRGKGGRGGRGSFQHVQRNSE